jgi:hypothetical protein
VTTSIVITGKAITSTAITSTASTAIADKPPILRSGALVVRTERRAQETRRL